MSEDRAWELVDAAKLNAVGHDGLLEPGDPEHSSTVSGDDTETAEHLLDEPARHAGATPGKHALHHSGPGRES